MSRRGYVYILASKKNGTPYTGMTPNLAGRLEQHVSTRRASVASANRLRRTRSRML